MSDETLTGIYRSTATGNVCVVTKGPDGMPSTVEAAELPIGLGALVVQIMREQLPDEGARARDDWYIDVNEEDAARFAEGGGDGTGEGTGEGDDHECGPGCECEVDYAGEGDGEGDEGDEGEGSPDAEMPERPTDQEVMDNLPADPPPMLPIDHPLGLEIWHMLEPNVNNYDVSRQYETAVAVTNMVLDYVDATRAALESKIADVARKAGGGGNGGGVTIKVKGRAAATKLDGIIHKDFKKVLSIVSAGVPAMLVGPPGTGKTFMAQQICDALGIPYVLQSFTPQTTESAIKGFMGPNGDYVVSPFRTVFDAAYGKPGAYILDEGDNCSPPVMTGLNSAMANRYMQFPDAGVHAADEFQFIMTANTWGTGPTAEFSGRAKLDPATLNRFAKIYIGTDESIEDQIVQSMLGDKKGEDLLKKVRHVRTAVEALGIKHFVTMRDSILCATLMQPGDGAFSTLEALQVTCLGPLTDDQQAKVKAYRA